MGKKENTLLAYYNQPERFAQLLNGWLFGGAECWKAEDISEADRRGTDARRGARERYRDLFKKVDSALVHLYIGTELMEYVDYTMPLREFPREICFLLMCIKYAKDKEAFSRLKELTGTAIVSEDTCEAIAEYLGEPELLEREAGAEGGRDMCKAIRDLVEDGRNEGIQQGVQLAKQILNMARENVPAAEIASRLSVSEKEVRQLLD